VRPYLETNPSHIQKRSGGVAKGVGPEFKSQYCKKKKIMCWNLIPNATVLGDVTFGRCPGQEGSALGYELMLL
jgi:hypothetical protein